MNDEDKTSIERQVVGIIGILVMYTAFAGGMIMCINMLAEAAGYASFHIPHNITTYLCMTGIRFGVIGNLMPGTKVIKK